MTSGGLLCQELRVSENFKDISTSFLSFQLLPEVSVRAVASVWAGPPGRRATGSHTVTCLSAGAALGGLCRPRQHLHVEPEGPDPAASGGSPPGLLRGQLHDQGEEAGKAGSHAPPGAQLLPWPRPLAACPGRTRMRGCTG